MTSANAKSNSSSGGESTALQERELALSKTNLRIRFASDRKAWGSLRESAGNYVK
jgi:hypothetical protein